MSQAALGEGVVRTPEERFEGLPGFGFEPSYRELDGVRLAHLDVGEGPPLLMLHGEPSWSFLFRKLIPPLVEAGYRCVVPDYAGFGRSDKPSEIEWYSYERHTAHCRDLVERLDLHDVTLVGHDWGGPIGLRLATAELPERFARFVLVDTPVFTGRQTMPPAWWTFHDWVRDTPDFPVADLIKMGCARDLAPETLAAYEAPFDGADSKAGVRSFPLHVLPRSPELPAAKAGWRVLKAMRRDERPTLMLWGELDAMFPVELARFVAGALRCEPPEVIAGAGHFLPEDDGGAVAARVAAWLASV
ncbi:MAG: haloalkane dehalogenase [Thermoleophilaceae bacterium]|nr:haloalkane dehalogenase [Thermoleophilaceae bacterium]